MILIVITPPKMRASGSLMKMLLLIIYLCHENIFKSVDISSLHMPLPISEMACMHIEDNEGSVFIIPPTKRDQSPIIFDRSQARATTSRESDDDLEPPQFFHYTRSAHCMMKRMGYSLNLGDGLNFDKGRCIPL